MAGGPLLAVEELRVSFPTEAGVVNAVTGVSFDLAAGAVLAVVGESGSGKSVTALALMGLHPRSAMITGSATFDGDDLLSIEPDRLRRLRGGAISMIFQDPMTSLNPVFTVGSQIVEAIRTHQPVPKKAARRRTLELLDMVGVPEPRRRAEQYPHEYSGGMRQRAMIAMAIANDPKLLIADEPTTALDVTVQAQVIEVLRAVRRETGAAMMLITHDLGLVAGAADRIQVMYAGRLFETGTVDEVFYHSYNPYTRALLASIPHVDGARQDRLAAIAGNPPSLLRPPSGCPFRPRCTFATDICVEAMPALMPIARDQASRCHHAIELDTVTVAEW